MRSKLLLLLLGVALIATLTAAPTQSQTPPTPLAEAEKAAAATQAEKATAEKTATERTAELERATVAIKAIEEAAAKVKAAADLAQGDAKGPAQKSLESIQQTLAAAQQVSKVVQAAKTAADQELAKKAAAALAAQQRVPAEKAWAARQAASQAEAERVKAEQELAKTTAAAQAATQKLAADQKTAADTATAKTAAEKLLAEKTQAAKATAQQAGAEPDAEKKKPLLEVAQKTEAERVVLEKDLAAKTAAAGGAAQKAAEAKAAADQAEAQRVAAEKTRTEKTAAIPKALDAAAVAHAEALGGLTPLGSDQWDYAKARHLLFRAGFGGTPEEVQRLYEKGLHGAVESLVEYHRQPPAQIEFSVPATERWLAYEQRLHNAARDQLWNARLNEHRARLGSLRLWWLRRMIESPRPLEEKLTLFWHDHFATGFDKLVNTTGVHEVLILHQQNQLLRRYADKFDALLHGIVQDPAMVWYLDNHQNRKGNVNENLGREVLELFSLGEENSTNYKPDGYSEQDVRDGNTRALTGVTVDYWTGQFRFYLTQHDTGEKTLLGQKGTWGPHEAADAILRHPHTARYIAKKLHAFFVQRQPDAQAVERMAHVLRENSYEVRPLLRNLFLSKEFYSPQAMAQQIKSPVELMLGTIKSLKLTEVDYAYVDGACVNMGQTLFGPPSVAGWPEGTDWINAQRMLERYNYVANLLERPSVDVVASLEGRTLQNASEVVDHLAQRCLLTGLSPEKRQALVEFLGALPPSTEWAKQKDQINPRLRALLVMLLSIPEYQVS